MATIKSAMRGVEKAMIQAADKAAKEAAEKTLDHIVSRTQRGVGVNERKFVPYASSTAKRKGRFSPVTLHETGQMLNDLYVKRERKRDYRVKFRTKKMDERGRHHQFGTNRNGRPHLPARRWFGVTTRKSRQLFNEYGSRFRTVALKDRRTRFRVEVKA